MLGRRHVPIQAYLAALLAIITLVIGISTAALFYDRMKTASIDDAVVTFDRISTDIAQQIVQIRLEIQYELALSTGRKLAKASSFAARAAAKDDLWPLLNANRFVYSAFVGYPNGDFLVLHRGTDLAIGNPPASLRGALAYAIDSVEVRNGRKTGRFWFYDRNRKLLAVQNAPRFQFDPRTRPWFKAGTNSATITEPYINFGTHELGYFISLRSATGSVFGAAVDMSSTTDLLARLRPTPSALAAVVRATSGVVFAFSDRKELERVNKGRQDPGTLADFHSQQLEAAFNTALQKPAMAASGKYVDSQGRVWLYAVTPGRQADGKVDLYPVLRRGKTIDLPRAVLVLTAPEDEIIANATRVRNDALIVCGALILMTIPIAYWLAQLVSGPLRRLRHDALALRSLDFTERPPRSSYITEVEEFSDTFGTMRVHIREHNEAVSNFIPHQFLELLGRTDLRGVKLGDHCLSVMTMLFSDIRAFTTLSGVMTPNETFRFVNSYLSQIGPIIREQDGFIDKYIGDAIFALFPERASDAVGAAIAMQRRVVTYNEGRARAGYAPIAIGIGVHRGDLMLGTIGESLRYETTVISDAVNIAARMESLTKPFGALILASGEVMESVERDAYRTRRLGDVLVKGAVHAVTVYEICDADPADLMEHKIRTHEAFDWGRLAYAGGDFKEAERLFREVAAGDARDHAAAYFRDRAAILASAVDVIHWDGVEHMESK